MSKWMRRCEVDRMENLARKAIRRGDMAEAVRCYHALNLRQIGGQRHNEAVMREREFDRKDADWKNKHIDLQGKLDELARLRRYVAWHPNIEAEKYAAKGDQAARDGDG